MALIATVFQEPLRPGQIITIHHIRLPSRIALDENILALKGVLILMAGNTPGEKMSGGSAA
jgi:hypothetical protein